MMKVELNVEMRDLKTKKKVLGAISGLLGVVAMAAEENKITVIGTADPIKICKKVRKVWPCANIISVGQEKEAAKKEVAKKEESQPTIEQIDWAKAYTTFYSYPTTHYYYPYQEPPYYV
ncbi:heavy metal-associated isoprenylated plant protein 39-like [Cucumis sativus]|uniref:heavy metal-associated isoprenylated plant protein 39-like n=1 Tax=Cucumis sativus TaxID=3659 RepID=UPI0012F4FA12|nr:heavy metal-associated isoprenylated plant protein 39-like [Cucumis sativus]KAE8647847.1 hypothetical protein Csa_000182 [Cucumis sativus]